MSTVATARAYGDGCSPTQAALETTSRDRINVQVWDIGGCQGEVPGIQSDARDDWPGSQAKGAFMSDEFSERVNEIAETVAP